MRAPPHRLDWDEQQVVEARREPERVFYAPWVGPLAYAVAAGADLLRWIEHRLAPPEPS